MNSKFSLTGKNAVVTGGGQGLGKAMALILANAGANVVVVDKQSTGLDTQKEIHALGRKSTFHQVDVSSGKQVEEMVNDVAAEYGRIDILINNAGIRNRKSIIDLEEEDWDRTVDVNLKSCFLMSKFVAKEMIKNNKGKIINISSIWHEYVFPERGVYSATKAGISQLTKIMAKEWAPFGVNVNAIAPGIIITPGNEDIRNDEKVKERQLPRIAFNRFGNTEDLEGAVVFLTSEASNYVTGQILGVDGGFF
jgi:NAD(P)-dependent dehydrogenase (short-subunit alcohol dehydrogenase family)